MNWFYTRKSIARRLRKAAMSIEALKERSQTPMADMLLLYFAEEFLARVESKPAAKEDWARVRRHLDKIKSELGLKSDDAALDVLRRWGVRFPTVNRRGLPQPVTNKRILNKLPSRKR